MPNHLNIYTRFNTAPRARGLRLRMCSLWSDWQDSQSQLGSLQSELESAQARAAALLTERNSYKNRAESLSREMHRLTRHGRSIEDIEELLNRLPKVEVGHPHARRLVANVLGFEEGR